MIDDDQGNATACKCGATGALRASLNNGQSEFYRDRDSLTFRVQAKVLCEKRRRLATRLSLRHLECLLSNARYRPRIYRTLGGSACIQLMSR